MWGQVLKLTFNYQLQLVIFLRRSSVSNGGGNGISAVKVYFKKLGIEVTSSVDSIKDAYISQAKRYHPDVMLSSSEGSKSSEKFTEIKEAYKQCIAYAQGESQSSYELQNLLENDLEELDRDILRTKQVAHRQFLSHDVGPGSYSERERAYGQLRLDRAIDNVFERKFQKSLENSNEKSVEIHKKRHLSGKKPNITHTLERLADDFIREGMARGDFENLKGQGQPIKRTIDNMALDNTTQKLNKILINSGLTPEWITLGKEIRDDIDKLKKKLITKWCSIGQKPLTKDDQKEWNSFVTNYCVPDVKTINVKIDKFNLLVPVLSKQKAHVRLDIVFKNVIKESSTVLYTVVLTDEQLLSDSSQIQQNYDWLKSLIDKLKKLLIN